MVVPVLPNPQRVNNLATSVNLLTKFEIIFSNAGPHVLEKVPVEGAI